MDLYFVNPRIYFSPSPVPCNPVYIHSYIFDSDDVEVVILELVVLELYRIICNNGGWLVVIAWKIDWLTRLHHVHSSSVFHLATF